MFFHNEGGHFVKRDIGLRDHRRSLAVGTGDLNNDGYTDLYIAHDFGHGQLYLNDRGQRLKPVSGRFAGSSGHDMLVITSIFAPASVFRNDERAETGSGSICMAMECAAMRMRWGRR